MNSPTESEAALDRAKQAYAANDFQGCEAICKTVLASDPQDVAASLLTAFCFVRTGRREDAVARFERALMLQPDLVEAHLGLSTTLFQLGRISDGKAHGYRAIELQPDDTGNRFNLAKLLTDHHQHAEAVPLWRNVLAVTPTNRNFLRDFATCLSHTGSRSEALAVRKEIVRLNPTVLPDWIELGKLFLADGQPPSALECAQHVLQREPNHIDGRTLAAMALSELGEAVDAEHHLRFVLQAKPDDPIALACLGLSLQEQGRFEEAKAPLLRSIEAWPTNGMAYYSLVRSQKITRDDLPLLAAIESALMKPGADPLHRSYMRYALGKAQEDLDQFEESMRQFDEANRLAYDYWLADRPWNRERYSFAFDQTIKAFDREAIANLRPETEVSQKPLLVIGMIRSGTTLVEQILSAHPDVGGAGELTFWHDQARRVFDLDAGVVDPNQMTLVAEEYLNLLDRHSKSALRVTDKMPHNYAFAGLIKAVIPGARLIHIRRNPVDNMLSIFTTAYQKPPAYALDRANILYVYREYRRIMDHWRATLGPEDLLEIDYEDLVANREAVTRRMIEFAGLEWSDQCLLYQSNERSVHTPSAWQVRQPIYKTSVERWRRFEPWIAPFDELLDSPFGG